MHMRHESLPLAVAASLIVVMIYAIKGSAKCRVPDTSQFGDK
jgi:hypothetical protein